MAHWNGKAVRVTALVFTGDVEDKLQRLQRIPRLSPWRPFRFCAAILSPVQCNEGLIHWCIRLASPVIPPGGEVPETQLVSGLKNRIVIKWVWRVLVLLFWDAFMWCFVGNIAVLEFRRVQLSLVRMLFNLAWYFKQHITDLRWTQTRKLDLSSRWISAGLQYLQCISNGDTAVLR